MKTPGCIVRSLRVGLSLRPALRLVLLLLAQTASQAAAQTGAVDSIAQTPRRGSFLRITTDPPGAAVYLDSLPVGTSPLVVRRPDPLRPGGPRASILTIVGGAGDDWYSPVLVDTLPPGDSGSAFPADGGDTLLLHYALPIAARISSDPAGAGVLLGDSLLGSTPLFATLPGDGQGISLRVRKEGYREEALLIAPPTFNYRVELARLDSSAGADATALAGLTGEGSMKLLVAAGIAVASGTTSALLKHKADESYDDYQATGDPATLDRVRRLDVSSALSLAVAQLAIGYLVIELLSR
jgi:hypothetical protein